MLHRRPPVVRLRLRRAPEIQQGPALVVQELRVVGKPVQRPLHHSQDPIRIARFRLPSDALRPVVATFRRPTDGLLQRRARFIPLSLRPLHASQAVPPFRIAGHALHGAARESLRRIERLTLDGRLRQVDEGEQVIGFQLQRAMQVRLRRLRPAGPYEDLAQVGETRQVARIQAKRLFEGRRGQLRLAPGRQRDAQVLVGERGAGIEQDRAPASLGSQRALPGARVSGSQAGLHSLRTGSRQHSSTDPWQGPSLPGRSDTEVGL